MLFFSYLFSLQLLKVGCRLFKGILNVLCIFRLAYFEIEDKVYTQQQLIQVAVKHYTSQVTFRVALSPLLTPTVQFDCQNFQ